MNIQKNRVDKLTLLKGISYEKLLTLLDSFALIASSAAITVACKTPSQEIKADESDKAKKGETKEEEKFEPKFSDVENKILGNFEPNNKNIVSQGDIKKRIS
ncbi:hypothetical protein V2P57_01850 [Mycoplasma mycoides subsp. mycoides]|uniref:Lipoprotein n=2 Tax=Mycoplasma mycoides subsp. mycoides TaxID=2103 RepID=A0AAE2EIV2_MYCMY|nr:hypothetical protein [Mycoplasma mycoides]CAE77002.1 hypothetical prolipoprotein [Mycoplasma mycoides subsp. mycoides SC str. PG1]ADK70108.1 conserved hypothetical protein [Mycoplasma mycoides subsp. mycoides SC str. Gladysdale]AIZ55223.1 prolipoprotein [Mycoplasma mycoides subsp. mycoides]AME10571.1 prolipoprotein [Mycoplasma mycoides subsp. mycoides]AME11577.1 prolipoprotein [Mycoplasma mycoides subsp. mycoides]